MFSFSFDKRKQLNKLQGFVRHLVDITCPVLPPLEGEHRSVPRSNRSLPVLIVPWVSRQPVVEEATFALSKDLSDMGISLVLPQPFRCEQFVAGFWLESPRFAMAEVRQNVPLGGGFWQLGAQLTELLDPAVHRELKSLQSLAAQLVPDPNQAEVGHPAV